MASAGFRWLDLPFLVSLKPGRLYTFPKGYSRTDLFSPNTPVLPLLTSAVTYFTSSSTSIWPELVMHHQKILRAQALER